MSRKLRPDFRRRLQAQHMREMCRTVKEMIQASRAAGYGPPAGILLHIDDARRCGIDVDTPGPGVTIYENDTVLVEQVEQL